MVEITAPTFFGARHGVESLLQLVVYSDLDGATVVPSSVELTDAPKYPHRGFLLDTSRNYFSVESIKRTIDAMAVVKLNSFHWHITDSHSFPFVAKSKPELHQFGAYQPDKVRSLICFAEILILILMIADLHCRGRQGHRRVRQGQGCQGHS
jgi:hexosaminidase